MPRYDGTGPLGLGPRTGRGAGPCGRGFGFRRFWGLNRRRWTDKDEISSLDDEEKALEEELKAVREEKKNLKGRK